MFLKEKEKNISKIIIILVVLAFIGVFGCALGSAEVANALSTSNDGYYEIKTLQDFKDYSQIIKNGGSGTKARMMADIDVTGQSDFVISGKDFAGLFDGNGYKISNVKASSGLFSKVMKEGIVKNLTVKIVSVGTDDQQYVGGITNENLGTIENCTVECGDIKAKHGVGAVAGSGSGTIKNCTAKIDGNIEIIGSSTPHMSGGVVGDNQKGGIVKGCRAYGTGSIKNVNGNGGSGGIVGWNGAKIESCICEGSLKIYNNRPKDYSGGITGYNKSNIDDCLVYGDVEVGVSSLGTHVGGLVGRMISGTCSNSFYNSSKAPLNGKHPVISSLEDGEITDCYYNAASGCRPDGKGTSISDIYWLKCDSNIKPAINADDKKTFAGRDFVYSEKQITLSYDGLIVKQGVSYSVNGKEIDGNSFKMPKQGTTVKARVGIAISSLEDLKKGTIYSGSEQSPGTVICAGGRIEEGTDYIVTKYQDSKGQETTEPPTDADTYIATIRGINKYAGNTTIEFKIVKADPKITKYPEALELTYNGNDQELLIGGTATGGTISYRLSTEDESSSSEKIPTAKDAGKYDILYKVKGDKNHNDLGEQKIQAEIKKAQAEITKEPKALELTYNGNAQELVSGGTATGGTMLYRLSTEDESSSSEKVPTAKDAGKYDILYKVKGDKNHNDLGEQKIQAEIKKAQPEITKEPKALELTYNGEAQELIENGICKGGTLVFSDKKDGSYAEDIPKKTDAGDYQVCYKVKGDNNHEDGEVQEALNVTIKKANSKYTKPKAKSLTYNGKAQKLITPGKAQDGNFIYRVDKNTKFTENEPTGNSAGTYSVFWKLKGDKNHNDTAVFGPIKVTIKVGGTPLAKMAPKGKNALTLAWRNMPGAKGYDIFFAKCGKTPKLIKSVNAKTLSYVKKGLKEKKAYKFYVKAWIRKDNIKRYVKTTPLLHAYTCGCTETHTSIKAVTVNKTAVTMKKGKTFKIKAGVVKLKKDKKQMADKHTAPLRYMTDNKKIATVSKSGVITAKGEGKCYVYAYAHNGISKKIKVVVQSHH